MLNGDDSKMGSLHAHLVIDFYVKTCYFYKSDMHDHSKLCSRHVLNSFRQAFEFNQFKDG